MKKLSTCNVSIILLCFFLLSGKSVDFLWAQQSENIKSEIDAFFSFERNKSLPNSWSMSVLGMTEIQNLLTIRGGVSFGLEDSLGLEDSFNFDAFALAGIQLPLPHSLSLNTSYIFNDYPAYDTAIHSLIPFLKTDLWRFELTFGYCFRFLFFNQDFIISEQSLAYRIIFHVIDAAKGNLSIYAANFSDFMCGNSLAYYFGLTGELSISSRVSFIGSLEILQTGVDGLTASFYGTVIHGGIRICL